MKKTAKIIGIVFLSLTGLLLLFVLFLLGYYQVCYKTLPLPDATVALPITKNLTPISNKPLLLPIPQKLEWKAGHFDLPASLRFSAPAEDQVAIQNIIRMELDSTANPTVAGNLYCIKNKSLAVQAYKLSITSDHISIQYNDLQGLFYAVMTIKQLAAQNQHQVPCTEIEDHPDLKIRGAMLDISRGKVPTLQTLYGMVDFLAGLKYNHLELYIEGFSFAYSSFKNLWEKTETPLSPQEIRLLDAYCKKRFIELVPNQNSLGHMDAWLATDQFKNLAECPEGYSFLGLINMKSTLAPSNPASIELVEKMGADLLPNFSSTNFNVDLDEPFELGKNKKHPIKDEKEIAHVYLNYAKKLDSFVNHQGKHMLMWGDVISRNPDIMPEIPKDITLLEWRYESFQDFENISKKYQQAGLHYLVCPGTSTWTSFTGRTDNMLANVDNAVKNAIQYKADGMLITDWGDKPHLQYLTVSYAGLSWAAALSWNYAAKSQVDLGNFLSSAVLKDHAHLTGNTMLDLGRYCQFEEYPMVAGTLTGLGLNLGLMDKLITDAFFAKFQTAIFDLMPPEGNTRELLTQRFSHPKLYNAPAILRFVDTLEQQLLQNRLQRSDSALIIDEYRNGIQMIRLTAKLKQYNIYHLQQTAEQNKTLLTEMKTLCSQIIPEHKRLWLARNKSGGLEGSLQTIYALQAKIDDRLQLMDQNILIRGTKRTFEMLTAAAAALYMR